MPCNMVWSFMHRTPSRRSHSNDLESECTSSQPSRLSKAILSAEESSAAAVSARRLLSWRQTAADPGADFGGWRHTLCDCCRAFRRG